MRLINTSYLYFFAPFPLFWDLTSWSFFVHKPIDIHALWLHKPSIPIPLVFLVTLAILILALVSKRKPLTFVCADNIKVSVVVLLLIGTVFFLNGVDVITTVQITMPIWLLCLLACQSNAFDKIECLSFYMKGAAASCLLHLCSIFIANDYSLMNVDRNFNFSTIFGFEIYQAQVNYPATMSIFTIVAVYAFLKYPKIRVLSSVLVISATSLGIMSHTRLFMLDLVLLCLVLSFNLLKDRSKGSKIFPVFVLLSIQLAFLFCLAHFTPHHRIFHSNYHDRILLMFKPFAEPENLALNLFSGLGEKHSIAHNYLIDCALNYGIITATIVLGMLVFMFTKLWKEVLGHSQSKMCFLLLLVIFITNNTFNSAATQPLFMANFLLALMLIWPLKKNVLGQPKEL